MLSLLIRKPLEEGEADQIPPILAQMVQVLYTQTLEQKIQIDNLKKQLDEKRTTVRDQKERIDLLMGCKVRAEKECLKLQKQLDKKKRRRCK